MSIEVPGHKPDSRDFTDKLPVSQWERHEARPSVDEVEAMITWLHNHVKALRSYGSRDNPAIAQVEKAAAMLRSLSVDADEVMRLWFMDADPKETKYATTYQHWQETDNGSQRAQPQAVDATQLPPHPPGFDDIWRQMAEYVSLACQQAVAADRAQRAQPQDGD
jgi:hypothetical protein